ncbi:MAG: hypothetical protein R3E09_00140 [Novosphingobium sp.]
MSRYFIPAIVLAVAPLSFASAEPTPAPEGTPPASCQQMHQSGGQGAMSQHMDGGAMSGNGHMMQHGTDGMGTGHMDHGSMGHGTMGHGDTQGQMMQHGDHAGMGPGNHQGMMQGQGQCPAASQTQASPTDEDK